MGRSPCCDENGLKKGPWTPEEDQKLVHYIHNHGHGSWRALPKLAGLNRCGKSCRLRWTNYLRPDIKRGKFSPDEEQTILNLHSILGNKWSAIATHLPGRTDNEIKNFWNTHLKKKLIQMGFDPMTHRPRTDFFAALPHLLALANLVDHRPSASWLVDGLSTDAAKLQCLHYILHSAKAAALAPDASTNINTNNDDQYQYCFNTMQSFSSYTTPATCINSINPPPLNIQFGGGGSTTMFEPPEMEDVPNLIGYDGDDDQQPNLIMDGSENSCFSNLFGGSMSDQLGAGESSNNHHFHLASSSSTLPPLIDAASNPAIAAEGCSSSSCGGSSAASFWPDVLLDDPFMPDFA